MIELNHSENLAVRLRAGCFFAMFMLGVLLAGCGPAQTFTTLHSFTATSGSPSTNSEGANPQAGLTLSGNTLFGTAANGGGSGSGTVFTVNTNGTGFKSLYAFKAAILSYVSILAAC